MRALQPSRPLTSRRRPSILIPMTRNPTWASRHGMLPGLVRPDP